MKRKLLPAIALGLVLLSATTVLADGDIYVGGPWGTRIASLPYTITAPGTYYLGGNLSYSGSGDGITIDTGVNHVTLDFMGFTIRGSGSANIGIHFYNSKNVEIRNGTLTGWHYGIKGDDDSAMLIRIINIRAVGNNGGLFLSGQGIMVKGCEATATGTAYAIFISHEGTVSGCTVKFIDGNGIFIRGGIVSDNIVISTGTGSTRYGIYANGKGALIKGNKVSGCAYGIYSDQSGLNIIGNTVDAASGATGIQLIDDYSNLLDQNTVTGAGTPYSPSTFSNAARRSNYPEASSP